MPPADSYSSVDVTTLNTRRTPIQKQPEVLLCLVGLSQNFFLGDDVYPTFLYDDDRDMDLFNLISAPNPTKVKTGTRPRAAHEVQDGLSGEIPSVENPTVTEVVPELDLGREVAAMGPLVNKRRRKRGNDEADANAPPKVLRKDHAASRPTQSTLGGKSLASMGLEAGSTFSAPASQETPADVSDPDPLSYVKPQPIPEQDIAQSSKGAATAGDPDSEKSSSFTSMVGSPGSIYQPGWGVTNNCRLDTPDVCQDMVDHIVPPRYFSELRHLPNDDFLSQYNINLARQVAMGSQLRLRFEQEVRLLKKATAKIAKRDQRIQAREEEIKKLDHEIKSLRAVDTEVQAFFTDLQVSNDLLSQQASTLHVQVTGEERIKAAFEEFKKYEDDRVFADVVSARIAKGMSEGLKHGVEHRKTKLDLEAIEAYDPKADTKYVAALHALKDLKYPIVDQLEKLKDAPIDVVMASLYLESDSGEDAPYRAENKKKCRVVCRTHGVGYAHHAIFDGVPVSVPTVAPQGLAILLADAATQTEIFEDKASPRLLRSKSLLPMYYLDWP
ncbi:hypothetical protein Tco_1379585 [Tanacetum coccineum]